jgi:hypothetical protein
MLDVATSIAATGSGTLTPTHFREAADIQRAATADGNHSAASTLLRAELPKDDHGMTHRKNCQIGQSSALK